MCRKAARLLPLSVCLVFPIPYGQITRHSHRAGIAIDFGSVVWFSVLIDLSAKSVIHGRVASIVL